MAEFRGRTLIWLVHRASLGERFDRILVMESGRVVEQGSFDELDRPGTVFRELALVN
jgi:ABC-type multidrug transport system fused ATPase/permease subunit